MSHKPFYFSACITDEVQSKYSLLWAKEPLAQIANQPIGLLMKNARLRSQHIAGQKHSMGRGMTCKTCGQDNNHLWAISRQLVATNRWNLCTVYVCVCMYVCVAYVCVYRYVQCMCNYLCMYVQLCVYAYMYVCIHHMCVRISVYVVPFMRACICMWCMYVYACMHMRVYNLCVYVCMCVHA